MKLVPVGGTFAQVDDADFELVSKHTWHEMKKKHTTYARTHIWVNGVRRNVSMHRFIMGDGGKPEIDHYDRNGLNNQRNNLRFATRSENASNRKLHYGKGVHWYAQKQKWRAVIGKKYLGIFHTEEEALAVRAAAVTAS
jgi:hypothetical protein